MYWKLMLKRTLNPYTWGWRQIQFVKTDSVYEDRFSLWRQIQFVKTDSVCEDRFSLWRQIQFVKTDSVCEDRFSLWIAVFFRAPHDWQALSNPTRYYEAPHCAVFSSRLLRNVSGIKISSLHFIQTFLTSPQSDGSSSPYFILKEYHRTVMLPAISDGFDTSSPSFREKHRLRMFANTVLRSISEYQKDEVTVEWRRLHDLYSTPNTRMRWAGKVACVGNMASAYRVLVKRPNGKRPLGRPTTRG